MMKILVTGSSGLLGVPLVEHLRAENHIVFAQGLTSGEIRCDLCSQDAVENLIEEYLPDVVINLVALTDVNRCNLDIEYGYRLNTQTAVNLCRSLVRYPDTTLIHISTDHVYDGPGAKKEDQVTIKNCYAMGKICAEFAALQNSRSVILRTNLFGKSQTSGRQSLSDWLWKKLTADQQVPVFTDCIFNPLSIPSLVRIIGSVAENPVSGTYNLGSRTALSKADFARRLCEETGLSLSLLKPVSMKTVQAAAERPGNMHMDVSLFEKTFKITLPELEDEIAKACQSYRHIA